MTQEEKWRKNYKEVAEYMDTYHRNPSKHRAEDHLMLNWMKHQRKLMNKGELKPERVEAFKRLLAKSDKLKRVNQWEEVVAEIMKNDALRKELPTGDDRPTGRGVEPVQKCDVADADGNGEDGADGGNYTTANFTNYTKR